MGISTDGQICFGIKFEEDFEFPWTNLDSDKDMDIEIWWRNINGFENLFKLWNDEGTEYEGGERPPEIDITLYYDHKRNWIEKNPIPLIEVNYCSGDCKMIILAIPESFRYASRGYAKEITGLNLSFNTNWSSILTEFCSKYNIEKGSSANWYLSSYWG